MTAEGELTLADILDVRAYERVRGEYRQRVMAKKRRRRVAIGQFITLVFECADTVRFQIQEMARVERITSDEGIQGELDIYNRLLPAPGELSATLFIELTSEEDLRHWLPRLVGIERAVAFELGGEGASGDPPAATVRSMPEVTHAEALTRDEVTPAVHYVRFPFTPAEVGLIAPDAGPAELAVVHPDYEARTQLTGETRAELLGDLRGETERICLG